jgi:hypothetical protein
MNESLIVEIQEAFEKCIHLNGGPKLFFDEYRCGAPAEYVLAELAIAMIARHYKNWVDALESSPETKPEE